MDESGKRIATTAAALMRMHAHSLSGQAQLLAEMSENLREQADRVEHGGDIPNLRVVDDGEKAEERRLPEITGSSSTESDSWPVWARDFLGSFHANYRTSRHFRAAWNEIVAGEAPSVQLANLLAERVRELETMLR